MWEELNKEDKAEYKKMILAFASLTEMFAQKEDNLRDNSANTETLVPVVNSKYQEKVFQLAFKAHGEDKNNTPYDASLNGAKKYIIGIKTFRYRSGAQKIAQFKTNGREWAGDVEILEKNRYKEGNEQRTKDEINEVNKDIYTKIAKRLAELRNLRINSCLATMEGFETKITDIDGEDVESVYHVLMTKNDGKIPRILVGETPYDLIDANHLQIIGCVTKENPQNFEFTDGLHTYRFTPADSQLLMDFKNSEIVLETWDVQYAENPYSIFAGIAESIYRDRPITKESYCWKIINENDEVEQFSGFNAFYGVGSRLPKESRRVRVEKFCRKFSYLQCSDLDYFKNNLNDFLSSKGENPNTKETQAHKVSIREKMIDKAEQLQDEELVSELKKLLFRPANEMYIPLPNSRKFHTEHPKFFVKGDIKLDTDGSLPQSTSERSFKLVFEPSGDSLEAYIAEQNGKAIESSKSMGKLGEWIRRKVFQLDELKPLTAERLKEIEINGIRLTKYSNSDDIHLNFIWIDSNNLPSDYWK